jgi:hypothetical protein
VLVRLVDGVVLLLLAAGGMYLVHGIGTWPGDHDDPEYQAAKSAYPYLVFATLLFLWLGVTTILTPGR